MYTIKGYTWFSIFAMNALILYIRVKIEPLIAINSHCKHLHKLSEILNETPKIIGMIQKPI